MLKGYEGNVPYMYLDTRGKVTVGVGFLLALADDAVKYTFYKNDAPAALPAVNAQRRAVPNPALLVVGQPVINSPSPIPINPAPVVLGPQKATQDEIKAEWANMKKQVVGQSVTYYKKFTTMKMLSGDIDSVLTKNVHSFEATGKQVFSNWDDFASPAQFALLDMIYNLGSLDDFPKLVEAAKKKDWATCANECYRNGPSPERNNDTKVRFEAAAREQPLPPPQPKQLRVYDNTL